MSQTRLDKKIRIGKIAQPHGVKGLVKILPFCEDISLIEQVTDFKIRLKNPLGKYILAEIEGLKTREDVEAVKGTDLYIPRSALPDTDEGQYYYEDLIGLKAVDESGEEIGKVIAVHDYGAGDLLEIKPLSGDACLIPLTQDIEVDMEAACVCVPNLQDYLS